MTVLTRLTPVTPGAISDPGIQNANRPLTISEIDSNFSDLYNFTLGKLAKTTDTFTGTLSIAGQLRFNGSVSGYVGFQSASTTANVLYTLPTSDGLNGQVLSTNGTGSLSWINQSAGGGGGGSGSGTSTSRTAFTATAGQTTFSVTYVVGQIDVYMNGSKLIVGTEVTASNGTSIVLAEAASAGDIVEAVVYSTQWISSGSNLYYDQGNVGFGVTNPAARIHVGSAATALATGTLRIDGADGAGTVNAPVTLNSVTDGATASGGSQFYIETRAPGGALTEKFRIDGDGNIGINNNNPQSALDVTGNVRISGSTTLSGGTANGVLYLNGSKVATSGSALTFDGSVFSVGDSTPATGLTTLNSIFSTDTLSGVNVLIRKSATGASGPNLTLAKSRGTAASPLAVANSDVVGNLVMYAYGGSNYRNVFQIQGAVDTYTSDTNISGYATFSLNTGSTTVTEQMRLTSTGLGIGTSSPGYKLDVNGTSRVTTEVRVKNTAGNVSYLTFEENGNGNSATFISGDARTTGNMGFWTNSTERMRLDSSGNLGIGTSSPGAKLDVNGNVHARGASFPAFKFADSSGTAEAEIYYGISLNDLNIVSNQSGGVINLQTGGGVKATLDASGNLGLGVTPSAWRSGDRALDIGSTASLVDAQSANTRLYNNTFVATGGTNTYKITAAASYYDQGGGVHRWFNAASGTAGNAISFTQAMTLFASGNLTIGGTNDSARLRVEGTTNLTTGLQLFRSGNSCSALWTETGALRFGVDGSTGFTELMQLNLSGNLGLGVTPSAWTTAASTRALQITSYGAALSSYGGGNTWSSLTHNAYYDGTNWKYTASSIGATLYQMVGANSGSSHSWSISAGGTAGNAISFTQAMTLDASANLTITPGTGVGLAATQTGLNVFGGASAGAATSPGVLTLGVNSQTVASGETLGRIQFYSNDASGASTGVVGKIDCVATSNFVGDCETALTFHTNDGVAGTIAERARITSGGDLILNTGTYKKVWTDNTEDYLIDSTTRTGWTPFITYTPSGGSGVRGYRFGAWNNVGTQTEWMRLWNGSLLIGRTDEAGGRLQITPDTSGMVIQVNNNYRVFNKGIYKETPATSHSCSIAFTSQGNFWCNHVIEITFAGGNDTSSGVYSGKAIYGVATLTGMGTPVEMQDIGSGVSFAPTTSGMSLIITATTVGNINWMTWNVKITSNISAGAPTTITVS